MIQLHNGYKLNAKDGTYLLSPYKREYTDRREVVNTFFRLLSAYNKLDLTPVEVQLLTHIALHGLTDETKKSYVKEYGSSIASVNNNIGKLKKKKLLVKMEGRKTFLNPSLRLHFNNNDKFIFTFKCLISTSRQTA